MLIYIYIYIYIYICIYKHTYVCIQACDVQRRLLPHCLFAVATCSGLSRGLPPIHTHTRTHTHTHPLSLCLLLSFLRFFLFHPFSRSIFLTHTLTRSVFLACAHKCFLSFFPFLLPTFFFLPLPFSLSPLLSHLLLLLLLLFLLEASRSLSLSVSLTHIHTPARFITLIIPIYCNSYLLHISFSHLLPIL